jgi:Flp pilus assembly protein TadG
VSARPHTGFRAAPGESGQALVEFALVLPLILILALGIIRVGNFYSQYQTLTSATAEAARTEAICRTGNEDASTVGQSAASRLSNVTFTFFDVTTGTTASTKPGSPGPGCTDSATTNHIASGDHIKVTGSAPNASINLGLFSITLPLSSSVTVIEE